MKSLLLAVAGVALLAAGCAVTRPEHGNVVQFGPGPYGPRDPYGYAPGQPGLQYAGAQPWYGTEHPIRHWDDVRVVRYDESVRYARPAAYERTVEYGGYERTRRYDGSGRFQYEQRGMPAYERRYEPARGYDERTYGYAQPGTRPQDSYDERYGPPPRYDGAWQRPYPEQRYDR
jgi:hypothetical protein